MSDAFPTLRLTLLTLLTIVLSDTHTRRHAGVIVFKTGVRYRQSVRTVSHGQPRVPGAASTASSSQPAREKLSSARQSWRTSISMVATTRRPYCVGPLLPVRAVEARGCTGGRGAPRVLPGGGLYTRKNTPFRPQRHGSKGGLTGRGRGGSLGQRELADLTKLGVDGSRMQQTIEFFATAPAEALARFSK